MFLSFLLPGSDYIPLDLGLIFATFLTRRFWDRTIQPLPPPQLKANIEYRTPNSEYRSGLALASFTSTFDIRYSAVRYSLFIIIEFDVHLLFNNRSITRPSKI